MNERNIGWAIIGCGRVADRRVAPAIKRTDGATLVGFCSRDAKRAAEYAARHDAPRAFASLEQALSDASVAAVYIATPNALHADQAVAALNAGKHVLVEKPMALSVNDARRMIATADRVRRRLGVVHQQRFHPANLHLLRCMDESLFGRLSILRAQIGIWYPHQSHWKFDPVLAGGGAGMDLGPHALDLMLEVGGPVARVSAWTAHLQSTGPVEDFCTARLEFANGGVGLLETSFCVHSYGGRLEVYGSQGTTTIDGSLQLASHYRTTLRLADDPGPTEQQFPGDCDTFMSVIEDFTDAVFEDRRPTVTAAHGLAVVSVLEAMYASARTGQVITLKGKITP